MILETWVLAVVIALVGTADSKTGGNFGNTSILRVFRLVRLVRMARMAKLVRLMPELMILIKGMMVATQTVFYTLCLLFLIIYIFGIAFMQLTKNTPLHDSYFNNLTNTMKYLLLKGILPDQGPFVEILAEESIFYAILMLVFILVGSLTVMNMLVGVLVEVVKTVSSIEKEQMDVNFVKNHLLLCIKSIDSNGDKHISKEEFEALLANADVARALQNINVDVVGLVDFMDYIFAEKSDLSFPLFMETVLQLRGNNTATVKDIVDLRKFMAQELWNIELRLTANYPEASKGINHGNELVSAQSRAALHP